MRCKKETGTPIGGDDENCRAARVRRSVSPLSGDYCINLLYEERPEAV